MKKKGLTISQFNVLEAARKTRFPFTKNWIKSPLENDGRFPVLSIEYNFSMPEEKLIACIKELRRPYSIKEPVSHLPEQNTREQKSYYKAVKNRNTWMLFIYKTLNKCPELKQDLPIYQVLSSILKAYEDHNFFKFPFTKPSNYNLSEESIKRLLNRFKE